MKNCRYLIFALLSLSWACENGEEPEREILPEINTMVNAIVVDKNNTKWIGTNEGLYKSAEDGYMLMELSVSGNIYSLFYEEPGDILWIGMESGLLKAQIEGEDITEYPVGNENLSHPVILACYIDNESKHWFGTEKGISLHYDDSWKKENFRVNSLGKLFAMAVEDFSVNSIAGWDGNYFFATSGAKLYRAFNYDASVDAFSGATQWDFPYNGLSITDTMFVVFIDHEGKKWMGGTEGVQVHTGDNPKDQSAFTYYYDELPDHYILAINQAPDGDIWIGTRKGLGVFNGTEWEKITGDLPDLYISSIAFDKDGSAWVGTGKGLVKIEY